MRKKIIFHCLFLLLLLIIQSKVVAQQYQPLSVSSGFNADVVANGVGTPLSSSTAGIDASNWALLSNDYQQTAGGTTYPNAISSNGLITSMNDANLTFQLNSLSANNSLRLGTQNQSGTLVFSNPEAALSVAVLVTSGDGSSTVSGVITFTDNTTQIFTGLSIPDWYNSTALPTVLWNMGRINRNTAAVQNPANNPRLYQLDIAIDGSNYGKSIQSLEFTKTSSGGVANILAVTASLLGNCPPPISLSAINGTPTSADFVWSSLGSETQWEIIIQAEGAPAPGSGVSGVSVNQMSYYANFLLPNTGYDVYVRAVCSGTEYSIWSGPFNYYTPVANDTCSSPTTIPVNSGSDCAQVAPGAFLGATVSPEPNYCGAINTGDIWFDFTATANTHIISLSNFAGAPLPIVLTVYEGNDCNSLTQVFCSSVNYITATGLTIGETYYIRASINDTNTTHTTTFDICVSTPDISGSNNSLECLIDTINSDFETPSFPSGGTGWYNHNQIQGWRTTASDEVIEMWNNFQGVTAYSGDQFIELNANEASGVYQDFDTPVSTVFNFGFAHRGRLGTDSCGLYAGPPGGPYTLIFTATTGNSDWQYYTGTYTVPNGQTQTRFIFEAISAAGGITVGNFLDAVTFTANNGILSDNPMTLDCDQDSASLILAAGVGTWVAHSDNPSSTTIDDVNSNTPLITGFAAPGIYRYDWTTLYCSSTLEINFSGNTVPAPEAEDVTYCLGQTAVPLQATALAGYVLNWYDVSDGGTALNSAPIPDTSLPGVTTYYVSQSSGASTCEGPRTPIVVTVNEPATYTITGGCEGVSYWLLVEGDFTDQALYSWTDSDNITVSEQNSFNVTDYLAQNPGYSIPEGGITFFIDINDNGCQYQDQFLVNSVFCSIPRGVSPNNDGLNDSFDLTGLNVEKLSIFNRYGKVVYEFNGQYTDQWKGQSDKGEYLPDATYYYYIMTSDGNKFTGWVYVNKAY
ncbi:gliding motility-associated C-terminal domain-containing protein [Flavobacterium sp. NRK F10]|uniref:gliding motility-associated C-terminal domain-containing protein n=2 Tax=Flavobacterium TaxID=237 RepID=UPI002091A6BF|nr:gliding motility-associated C-terminal domain-containing protein [Flavobacterium sp. NRK F10]MCO6174286.1 gliding motility-associated C-terminal domain-containing protein [Flavobacterium sp. NRK F10]